MIRESQRQPLRALATAALLAFAGTGASAHEIKVMLEKMDVKPGDRDVVFLSWGHRLPTDQPTRGKDLERYRITTPHGSVRTLTTVEESDQRNVLELDEEGVYTAEAIRKPAVMTVFRFEDRHVHFLGPKTRIRKGAVVEDSFRSHQFAKAIATAGKAGRTPTPLGHVLEIVPASPPAEWAVGRDIPFVVRFEGRPISGKLFQARPLGFRPDDVWTWTRPTDQEGRAVLRADRPGAWLLKATVERPAPASEREQFDVDHWTATLILEIRPAAALPAP
jgi:uncharacterized GH25 family protein